MGDMSERKGQDWMKTESFKLLTKPYTLKKYDDSWIKINMSKVNNLFRLNLRETRIVPTNETENEDKPFFVTGLNGLNTSSAVDI